MDVKEDEILEQGPDLKKAKSAHPSLMMNLAASPAKTGMDAEL